MYVSDISSDTDAPSVGLSWEPPAEAGDQPIESYMIEGTALPDGWTPDKTDGHEWVCIDESVSKDVDYYEINQWNYQGFQEMLAAKEFANLPSGGALAPKPKTDFLFRVACKSSVGYGESSSTEVVSLGEQEDEKAQEDETDEPLCCLQCQCLRATKDEKGPHRDVQIQVLKTLRYCVDWCPIKFKITLIWYVAG